MVLLPRRCALAAGERRPGGGGAAEVPGEVSLCGAVGVHDIDLGDLGAVAPGKGDLLSVRRPGSKQVRLGIAGQVPLAAAVRVHHVDVAVAAAVAVKDDPATVRRPASDMDMVVRGVAGQVSLASTVRIHHVDLVVAVAPAREGDVATVW